MSRIVPICIALLLLGAVAVPAQDDEIKALEDMFKAAKGELAAKRDSALKTLVELDGAQSKTFWALVKDSTTRRWPSSASSAWP